MNIIKKKESVFAAEYLWSKENIHKAIVYDSIGIYEYEIYPIGVDLSSSRTNLILSCSGHQNIDIYSLDVGGYNEKHSCLYLKDKRMTLERFIIIKLNSNLLGIEGSLTPNTMNEQNFNLVIERAQKTISINIGDKRKFGLI